jgi:hypothetical protein
VFDLGPTGHNLAQQISDLRDAADGPGDKDQGVVLNGAFNLVPSDANGVVFSRTTSEVLRIVYLTPGATPASRGGFFPNGVNGTIRTANHELLRRSRNEEKEYHGHNRNTARSSRCSR